MKLGRRSIAVSLKSALMVGILSIVSLMFVACYIFIYKNIRDTIIRQHQETIARSIELEGKALQQYLEEIERQTLELQYDKNILDTIQSVPEDDIEEVKMRRLLVETFRDRLASVNGVNWICLISDTGSMVGASSKLTSHYPQVYPFTKTDDFFDILNHSKGCLWFGGYSDALFSQYPNSKYIISTFSEDVLLCARKIYVETMKDTKSVLILAVDEEELYNKMGIFTAEPFNNVCIFNDDGDMMLCYDEAQAGFLARYHETTYNEAALYSSIEEIDGLMTHILSMSLDNGWSILCTVPMQYYYNAIRPTLYLLLGIACISLVLINIWCILLISQATKQLSLMTVIIDQVGANLSAKMNETGLVKEFNTLSKQFNIMLGNLKEASAEKREMEIQVLQSQIKPHFLYNTILSIRLMAEIMGARNVADALLYLSDIIRPIFESSGEVWSIKQEIELLDNYAKLMELRFGKHAEYDIRVDEAISELMVPRMLLQPLLENCYLHSIGNDAFITISIRASVVQRGWELCICDNGRGIDADTLGRLKHSMQKNNAGGNEGIGVANVYYRLKKYYGDDFDMAVISEPEKGTSVTISLYRPMP